ncbi:unnamed protein product [Soboliphyme baturini]|uniref:Acyl_transf_3 domain-containing protein n=1 Tax=Soboliphyme baturini TaxID=241478 RepID=A0A183J832_9BILA|nr:unnamed protein product [Soboliphyme baturini]
MSKSHRTNFDFPSLPSRELCLYIIVVVVCVIYSYHQTYIYSSTYDWKHGNQKFVIDHLWFFGEKIKDSSDVRWMQWKILMAKMIPYLIIHSLLFNLGQLVLPDTAWSALMLAYWMTATVLTFGSTITVQVIVIGILLYAIASLTRKKWPVWMAVAGILLITAGDIFALELYSDWFTQLALVLYKLIQYITFCVDTIDSKTIDKKSFLRGLYDMFFYAFYFPYQISLIVPFHQFRDSFDSRNVRKTQTAEICILGMRLLFWYTIIETAFHFFYFSAMVTDLKQLEKLPTSILCCMGSIVAQFFHMEYMLIFGLPGLFARLDKLEPPALPICISRCMSYKQTWRSFDRGMYKFFKCYVVLPFCQPSFSAGRRLVSLIMCCLFALTRHRFQRNCIAWMMLNVVGMIVEHILDSLFANVVVQQWRRNLVTGRTVRRLRAILSLIPFIFKVYAHFYFLTSFEAGNIFFQKLFLFETLHFKPLAIVLLICGYCFSNVVIELERRNYSKGIVPQKSAVK